LDTARAEKEMKIYLHPAREDWICDRFCSEFAEHRSDLVVTNPWDADILWLIADWCWKELPLNLLQSKKVLTTVHHITPWKFSAQERQDFANRDLITDAYHVPCQITHDFIRPLTQKPIFIRPFWVDPKKFFPIPKYESLRTKHGIKNHEFILFSSQRDTEGGSIASNKYVPKREKGPEEFFLFAKYCHDTIPNTKILLGGWRRQWLMQEFNKANIPFYYFELPSLETINEFYNLCDLYAVTAKAEGHPMSILECAATKTPVVSTRVGVADIILPEKSLFKTIDESFNPFVEIPSTDPTFAWEKVQQYMLPHALDWYVKNIFEKII
jgi:glycosyltransferase involved in cell wall biosynthesis